MLIYQEYYIEFFLMKFQQPLILYLYCMLFLLSACSKGEIPGQNTEDEKMTIQLRIQFAANRIPYSFSTTRGNNIDIIESDYYSQTLDSGYTYRAILEIYDMSADQTPIERKEIILGQDLNDIELPFVLEKKKYQFAFWCDCVEKSQPKDLYYNTSKGLKYVKIIQSEKIAYPFEFYRKNCLSSSITLDPDKLDSSLLNNVRVTIRPSLSVAQLLISTTDIINFIAQEKQNMSSQTLVHVDSLQARILYQGFTPCGLNVLSGKLNDARIGITLQSHIMELQHGEALVAADCILSEEKETNYNILLQLMYNGQIKTESVINMRARKEKSYSIRSNFLSKETSSGGLNVDTGFDGIIDIVLPD